MLYPMSMIVDVGSMRANVKRCIRTQKVVRDSCPDDSGKLQQVLRSQVAPADPLVVWLVLTLVVLCELCRSGMARREVMRNEKVEGDKEEESKLLSSEDMQ
jgi:hypothetical protein